MDVLIFPIFFSVVCLNHLCRIVVVEVMLRWFKLGVLTGFEEHGSEVDRAFVACPGDFFRRGEDVVFGEVVERGEGFVGVNVGWRENRVVKLIL